LQMLETLLLESADGLRLSQPVSSAAYWHLRRLPHWIPLPLDSITLGFHYPWILK
jgi:hypothetical protein